MEDRWREREGAAIKVYSSIFTFLRVSLSEMEPYGAHVAIW